MSFLRAFISGCSVAGAVAAAAAAAPLTYPETVRGSESVALHERAIPDPYRWLEGDPKSNPNVRAWIAQQNALTRSYLDALPNRKVVHQRLTNVWNFERLSPPRVRGGREFLERNSGLQNQNIIVVREGENERILVDPNTLSKNGSTVVADWKPSPDGNLLLYAVQPNGGDRRILHLLDVRTGADQIIPIQGIRTPAFDWSPDSRAIYYTRYPNATDSSAAPGSSSIFMHRLGTNPGQDIKLFDDPSGGRLILWARPTDDPRWLAIEYGATDGSRSDVSIIDLADPKRTPVVLIGGLKSAWRFVGATGGKLYFYTTDGAPRGRVVSLDRSAGQTQKPVTIAPEGNATLQQAVLAGNEIVVRSLEGLRSRLHRYSLDGRDKGPIALEPLTVVSAMEGRSGAPSVYFTSSSLVMAPTLHRFDLSSGSTTTLLKPRTFWNPADYVVRQINARSRDGTMVPVTLAYRRSGVGKSRPTLLMVYGGWGLSVDLAFAESRFAWMSLGGVFAIAHIRGGGEKGQAWHRAAIKEGHVRGIDDFAAAAATLQRLGITTPPQTIAYGSSNGGMMTAATINKYPRLFGAAIPRVPVTDLVRFPNFTSGRTWVQELGDPSDPAELTGILTWSPLHNVAKGKSYPAVLVNTALGDDRVVPMHSFKYIAMLQNSQLGDRPKLLRIEEDAGHGQGKSSGQLIDEFTDLWSFAANETNLPIR